MDFSSLRVQLLSILAIDTGFDGKLTRSMGAGIKKVQMFHKCLLSERYIPMAAKVNSECLIQHIT